MSIELFRPTFTEIRYFGADRFFPGVEYRAFCGQKILCDEIVSFDCLLFEMQEIDTPDSPLPPGTRQLIALILRPDADPADCLWHQGFTFCGYDLVDEQTLISTITGCDGAFSSIPSQNTVFCPPTRMLR